MKSCTTDNQSKNKEIVVDGKTVQVIKEIHDTVNIPVNQVIYQPGKSIHTVTIKYLPLDTTQSVDTQLKEFNALKVYKDSVILKDSLGIVKITDTLYQNKIQGRIWDYSITKRQLNNTLIVKDLPKNEWFLGASTGAEINSNLLLGTNLTLIDKQKKLYQIGLGINSQAKPYVQVGLSWKLTK
jgi:hypothetical protein